MKRMKPGEVFEYLDSEYRFIVGWQNPYGKWSWYYSKERPVKIRTGWGGYSSLHILHIAIDYDGPWEESLFERPKLKTCYYYNTNSGLVLLSDKLVADHWCKVSPEVAEWFHKIMEDER